MANDGGPAFPQMLSRLQWVESEQTHRTQIDTTGGMTLRDYFAGQALIGAVTESGTDTVGTEADHIAQWCYVIADAMLKAREQA